MTPAGTPRDGWPIGDRLSWVRRFRRLVADDIGRLTALVEQDTGKPEWETITSDILPLIAACRWHERRARRVLARRRLRGRGMFSPGITGDRSRVPLGDVLIIATWNYPIQLLGIQLVSAITGGNRVTVKPSERSPRSQRRLLELAREAGLPDGTLDWTEPTRRAGADVMQSRRFDHVVFTGSTGVGKEIAASCAGSLTDSTLELSGRDSALVLRDADPALAAGAIWSAVVRNAGQTCMAPRRALVDRAIYDRFIAALRPLVASSRPATLISPESAEAVHRLASDALERGARSITGVIAGPDGRSLTPLAIADCPPDAPLTQGDHFGPALAIVGFDSIDEALSIHDSCDQHLATSVFTRDLRAANELAQRLQSGTVTINDCVVPVGHPATSIGGRGASGWGSSRGIEGLFEMTRPLTVTRTSRLVRIPTSEPPASQLAWIRRIARWTGGARRAHQPAESADPSTSELPSRVLERADSGAPER